MYDALMYDDGLWWALVHGEGCRCLLMDDYGWLTMMCNEGLLRMMMGHGARFMMMYAYVGCTTMYDDGRCWATVYDG